jgi:hypothetical protein
VRLRLQNKFNDYYPFLLIFLVPLILLLVNPEWIYPEHWSVDSYLNHRYAFHFPLDDFHNDWYKAERVAWLIPLYLLKQVVGAYDLLLVWGVFAYWGLGLLYYGLLTNLYGRARAVATLPLIILYPHLISFSSGGGAYHSYCASLYFLASLFLLVKSLNHIRRKERTFLLLSGFFLGSTIITSLLYLNLLLIYPVLLYFKKEKLNFYRLRHLVVGFFLAYLFWSFLNIQFDRGWVSFLLRLETLFLHSNPEHLYNTWYKEFNSLFFLSHYCASYLGIFMGLGCANLFILWQKRKHTLSELILSWHAVLIVGLWFLWHAFGLQSLLPPDFSYPLQIPIFLTLPIFLPFRSGQNTTPLGSFQRFTLVSGCLFLFANIYSHNGRYNVSDLGIEKVTSFVFLVLFIVALLSLRNSKKKWSALFSIIMIASFYGYFNDPYKNYASNGCSFNRDSDQFVINIANKLRPLRQDPRDIFIYHSPQEKFPMKSCPGNSFQLGRVIHHISSIFGSPLYKIPGAVFLMSEDPYLIVDKQFFIRVYEQKGALVIISHLYEERLKRLKEIAESYEFSITEDEKFSYQLAERDIFIGVHTLKR